MKRIHILIVGLVVFCFGVKANDNPFLKANKIPDTYITVSKPTNHLKVSQPKAKVIKATVYGIDSLYATNQFEYISPLYTYDDKTQIALSREIIIYNPYADLERIIEVL